MGKIFYIMGKSSSGKDSIYRQLEGNQELGLKRLVIYTTRPIRDGEENGREYFFADENKLKEFRRNGKLIERVLIRQFTGRGHILLRMTGRCLWVMTAIWGSVHWSLL